MLQPRLAIAIPSIEAAASAPVIVPPAPEQTDPLRAPPSVVEGEILVTIDDFQPPLPPPPGRWRARALGSALAVLCLALGATATMVLTPLLLATATITLTPEAHTLTTTASIPLAVRLSPAEHQSLSATIATTGRSTRPATAARGLVTFYNALPAPQTIPAGTLLMSPGGIPVLTEEEAYIPAASPPTDGVSTVSAQAENTGMTGNIAAGAISGPFSGGADARSYRTPTIADISSAAALLQRQIDATLQRAIHAWLLPGAVLLPAKCTASRTSSAQPGDAASQVTVTVAKTCSAAAYAQSDLVRGATTSLDALAGQRWGPAFRLWGAVHTSMVATTSLRGQQVTLQTQVAGTYVFSFDERQLTNLRAKLAGMSRDRARVMLANLVGVTQVQIQSSNATLPGDASRIHILLSS